MHVDSAGSGADAEAFGDLDAHLKFSSVAFDDHDTTAAIDILRFEQPDAIIQLANDGEASASAGGTPASGPGHFAAAHLYWSELPKGRKRAFRYVYAWGVVRANRSGYVPGEMALATSFSAEAFPVVSVRSASVFGPYQAPNTTLSLLITDALLGRSLTIANLGPDRTAWLHIEDMARGIAAAAFTGEPGSRYALHPAEDVSDLELVHRLCEILGADAPRRDAQPHASAITIDGTAILTAISPIGSDAEPEMLPGWAPHESLAMGLQRTVAWYAAHPAWWLPQRLAFAHGLSISHATAAQNGQGAAA